MTAFSDQFLALSKGCDLETLEDYGTELARQQRGVNFWLGDLARYAEARFPDTWHQAFPEWVSPGLVARCAAVAKAYPNEEDRNILATWSQHMSVANKPDRRELLAAMVDKGQTTDESRKEQTESRKTRWLLAIDVNYFLHRFWFSGAGIEAAVGVATWVERTVERLKQKGLTDCACCFDAKSNHRKELTSDWDDKYKDRPPKDPELGQQLDLVRELLTAKNFACVSIDGMEGDDIMASFAKQFQGRVTLLTQDKDMRQALSSTCNMLMDVEWEEDETSGEMMPLYKWMSSKVHTETTGIKPEQWTEFQTLMGDACDGIKGCVGVGEKGAADLIKEFGTVEGTIQAAKDDDERIKPAKRKALIEFEPKVEVTRQLVTLRTDLPVPDTTRI